MQSYTVRFHVDAPPRKVWRVLHPPVPPNAPRPRSWETVIEAEINKLSRYVAVGAPAWSRGPTPDLIS